MKKTSIKKASMTVREIEKLYETYRTPQHVRRHMRCVAQLAVRIAQKIKKNTARKKNIAHIDVLFTRHLALLHDILKPLMFRSTEGMPQASRRIWKNLRAQYPRGNDTDVAGRILKKMRYTELARAIRSQVFDAPVSQTHSLRSLEEKVVYYADKRIAHTKKVSLRARLDEGYARYYTRAPIKKSPRLLAIERKIFALEKELSRMAGTDLRKE